MAEISVNNSGSLADPIAEAQVAVGEVRSLLQCVELRLEGGSRAADVDLVGAVSGVIKLLDKLELDLDPMTFRAAVYASRCALNTSPSAMDRQAGGK